MPISDELKQTAAENVATVAGAGAGSLGGAGAGAVIGTLLCPGPGTAIGIWLGGIVGGLGGGTVAKSEVKKAFKKT